MHVAGLRRKTSLGLRWVRDMRAANAADVLPRCRTPSPAGGEVQQGRDAAEPLQAALLGGTTSPSRFRCKAENASYLECILMRSY